MTEAVRVRVERHDSDSVRVPVGGMIGRANENIGTAEMTLRTKPTPDDFRDRIEELESEVAGLRARCRCGN